MEKHKIILVPFPFDDFSELKVRPAVCLTNSIGKHNHVVMGRLPENIKSLVDQKMKQLFGLE